MSSAASIAGAASHRTWPAAGLVFAIALAVRLAAAQVGDPVALHALETDEMYHLLAARSWVEDGSLSVGDGEYRRGYLFTIALGWLFAGFGENELLAKVFSMIMGGLSVVAVFVWTRWVAGSPAAWIAAMLYGLAPVSLDLSQFIRFYTLHGLAFFLGAAGVYALVMRRPGPVAAGAVAIATAGSLALSLHLQLTTLIGLAGLGAWLAFVFWHSGRAARAWDDVWPRWAGAAAILLLAAAVAWAAWSGLLPRLWGYYTAAPLWAAGNQGNVLFYHYLFLDQYPTLWTLLPLAALLSVVRRPGPAIFCLVVLCASLALHSFAGTKWERYVYYALPFFFIVWGIAIAEALPALGKLAAAAAERLAAHGSARAPLAAAKWAGVGAVLMFVLGGNSAFPMAFKMIAGGRQSGEGPPPSWTQARDALGPWLDRAEVVVATNGPRALYYFGRLDFELNRTVVRETDTREEFGTDQRTGRQAISTADSLRLVVTCHASGLFVSERRRWRQPISGIGDAAADVLEALAQEIAVPPEWRLRAFAWEGGGAAPGAACGRTEQSSRRSPGATGRRHVHLNESALGGTKDRTRPVAKPAPVAATGTHDRQALDRG